MFTICVFAFASLFADHPTSVKCLENISSRGIETARMECAAIARDPFHTCEMERVGENKYAMYIRKLDGV